jgi:hypothetical protein
VRVDWDLAARIARTTAGATPLSSAPDGLAERADAAR